MEKLINRFRNYITSNSLVTDNQSILLAVSGGVDSMVMMSLFADSGYDIAVAHCNFQLRGEESREDEIMVLREAEKLAIPVHNKRFDTEQEMLRTGESVQMAARRLRYEWFDQLCRENNYCVVAIAHHADDSIETFFINLLRGTGLKGLTGISISRGRVIRPMMFATRKEILDYAHANKVVYREDSSNRSTKYLRNKIRLGLVPRLREISPSFNHTMGVNIRRLTDAQLFINRSIELIRGAVQTQKGEMRIIDVGSIDPVYPVGFVMYELLSVYGFKGDTVDALYKALEAGHTGRRFYSKDYVAYADRGKVIVEPIPENDTCAIQINRETKRIYAGNSAIYCYYTDIDNIDQISQPEHVALLDSDLLKYPLVLRKWQEGDWFVPLGMSGKKKVSDFLIDRKIPLAEKNRQFVLVSGEDIVWVLGMRIDDRYKITDKTENVLRLTREIL